MGTRLFIATPEWTRRLASWGFRSYDDLAGCERGEIIASTRTSQTRRFTLGDDNEAHIVYLKRIDYAGRSWRHRLLPAKTSREARNYGLLRRCGIPTAEVIAYGRRRRELRLTDSFILTRGIADAVPLEDWMRRRSCNGTGARLERRRLTEQAVSLVSRMHRCGFFHVDLQWRNLLVCEGAEGLRLFVIDSSRGGMRYSSWMRRHGRLRDLSSLEKSARHFLTRPDRIRWLRAYLSESGCIENERALIRWIVADRIRKDGGSPP